MNRFTENWIGWLGEWEKLKSTNEVVNENIEKKAISQFNENILNVPEDIRLKYGLTKEILDIFSKSTCFNDFKKYEFKIKATVFTAIMCILNGSIYDSGTYTDSEGKTSYRETIDNIDLFYYFIVIDILILLFQINENCKGIINNIILKGERPDYTNRLKLLNTDCFSKLFPKLNIQICDK